MLHRITLLLISIWIRVHRFGIRQLLALHCLDSSINLQCAFCLKGHNLSQIHKLFHNITALLYIPQRL